MAKKLWAGRQVVCLGAEAKEGMEGREGGEGVAAEEAGLRAHQQGVQNYIFSQ